MVWVELSSRGKRNVEDVVPPIAQRKHQRRQNEVTPMFNHYDTDGLSGMCQYSGRLPNIDRAWYTREPTVWMSNDLGRVLEEG